MTGEQVQILVRSAQDKLDAGLPRTALSYLEELALAFGQDRCHVCNAHKSTLVEPTDILDMSDASYCPN